MPILDIFKALGITKFLYQHLGCIMKTTDSIYSPLSISIKPQVSIGKTYYRKNEIMNNSAILTDKLQLRMDREVPTFIMSKTGKRKSRTVCEDKAVSGQGIHSRTINKIIENSIKAAYKQQQSSRKCLRSAGEIAKRARKSRGNVEPMPREVLNIFYRQNIKNYNPFMEALSQVYQNCSVSEALRERMLRLCYVGVARDYFSKKKYFVLPHYSRVGIQIRTYMMAVMQRNYEEKCQTLPHNIYIRVNPTALSFNPYLRPPEIQDYITKKRYSEVIGSVNKIIEGEYKNYKSSSFEVIKNTRTYSEVATYLIVLGIIVWGLVGNTEQQLVLQLVSFFSALCIVLGGMGLAWLECNRSLKRINTSNNVSRIIQIKLQQYLKEASDSVLNWKVGQDFYWIEIQNLKVKRKWTNQNKDEEKKEDIKEK